jgi:hypothetical protein
MLELLLCFALATALERARRARHRVALFGGAVVAYLLVADTLSAIAGSRGDQQVFSLFNYLFIGPGVAPIRSPAALPLPAFTLDQPWLVRVARVLVCSATSWMVLRESAAQPAAAASVRPGRHCDAVCRRGNPSTPLS